MGYNYIISTHNEKNKELLNNKIALLQVWNGSEILEVATLKIGDRIKFKDCEETPCLYNHAKDILNNMMYSGGVELWNYGEEDIVKQYHLGKRLKEYVVINIEYKPHGTIYWLGHESSPIYKNHLAYDSDVLFGHYPLIIGDKLMNDILALYNK